MRCLFQVSIAMLLLGCSGSGVSTTARGSVGDTDDTAMESSTAPMTTDPSTSGEPPATTSGTTPMTTTDPEGSSGMPMTEESG
jgi:hypothetical protein